MWTRLRDRSRRQKEAEATEVTKPVNPPRPTQRRRNSPETSSNISTRKTKRTRTRTLDTKYPNCSTVIGTNPTVRDPSQAVSPSLLYLLSSFQSASNRNLSSTMESLRQSVQELEENQRPARTSSVQPISLTLRIQTPVPCRISSPSNPTSAVISTDPHSKPTQVGALGSLRLPACHLWSVRAHVVQVLSTLRSSRSNRSHRPVLSRGIHRHPGFLQQFCKADLSPPEKSGHQKCCIRRGPESKRLLRRHQQPRSSIRSRGPGAWRPVGQAEQESQGR